MRVERVAEGDIQELLPLMRGYLEFYEVAPPDESVLALVRALLAEPDHEGVQLIARDPGGAAVGFATVYWSWSTTRAARIAVMNDLFVAPGARGAGAAEALIDGCARVARERGAVELEWMTARDNLRAQAVYDRVGGERDERWLTYSMPL